MQVFMEILAKSGKLPLAGYDSRSNREAYVRSLIEGGLTAFSSVLNQERIYLPTRYTEHVFDGMTCEMWNIKRTTFSTEVYARSIYAVLCGMHAVWVDWHQKYIHRRSEYYRLFLPFPLQDQNIVSAFLDVWRCIMQDLEQCHGDHQVLDFWRQQQVAVVRCNGISSEKVLADKIRTGSLEFDYRTGFTWIESLKSMDVAKAAAKDVMMDLTNVMREVNS